MATIPEKPQTDLEQYLNRIATGDGEIPAEPHTNVEQYLNYIIENGIGGGELVTELPAEGQDGRLYVLVDDADHPTKAYGVYTYAGGNYVLAAQPVDQSVQLVTTLPQEGQEGVLYYLETQDDTYDLYRWINGSWVKVDTDIILYGQTGNNTDGAMTQNATTSMVFADPSTREKVQIGTNASVTGTKSTAIGWNAKATNGYATAFGEKATASGSMSTAVGEMATASNSTTAAFGKGANASGSDASAFGAQSGALQPGTTAVGSNTLVQYQGSVALGAGAIATRRGEIYVGSSGKIYGYNGNSNYRVIGGVYDPQQAHDAATKGYVDGQISSIRNAIINGGYDAPDQYTEGQLGSLYVYVDDSGGTPVPHLMVCTDDSGPYIWTEVGGGGNYYTNAELEELWEGES